MASCKSLYKFRTFETFLSIIDNRVTDVAHICVEKAIMIIIIIGFAIFTLGSFIIILLEHLTPTSLK